MNNSNQTLRFSRTSREAYGGWIQFESDTHWAEPLIWIGAVFGFGTLFGAWLF